MPWTSRPPGGGRGRHTRPVRHRRRSVVLVAAAVLLAGLVVIVAVDQGEPGTPGSEATTSAGHTGSSGSASTASSTTSRRSSRHSTTAPRTVLGSDGVESAAIIAENQEPGTVAWKITDPPASGSINGFAGTTDATPGQSVTLYVSTTAPQFTVAAYRMGYYQGKGARLVWRSGELAGRVQPACPVTPGVNMVSCDNWSPSLRVTITRAFVQGDYLFKLTGSGNQQSYVLLTVSDPASTAAYLVMARSMTEEGWNTYGGYDFYQGEGPCTLGQTTSYPPCNRARAVSFDRPFATGDGITDFLSNEYPLVRFMEEHGLDVAYTTDVAVAADPTLLLHHRTLVSLGHDETWTYSELVGAQTALAHGVNIAFLGAAPLVRHARLQSSPLGPDREVVDYRDAAEDPLAGTGHTTTVTGNTFATAPTSVRVTTLIGSTYSGYLDPGAPAQPLVVETPTAWIFRGTGLERGATVPGVNLSDINHADPASAPADLEVLGHSPIPLSVAYTNQGKWGGDTYADMTYYTDPRSQGGVFESGTVNWIYALDGCAVTGDSCTSPLVARMTGNLLRLFGQGPAGKLDPSVANLDKVTPPGS